MPFSGEWIDYCEVFCYTIYVSIKFGSDPSIVLQSYHSVICVIANGTFLFPANSFGHKASSPSGVLAFVIYQGGIAVKIKERSISLCKTHARTAIIRCSVPI